MPCGQGLHRPGQREPAPEFRISRSPKPTISALDASAPTPPNILIFKLVKIMRPTAMAATPLTAAPLAPRTLLFGSSPARRIQPLPRTRRTP